MSLPILVDFSMDKFIADPTIEFPPELAVEPPPPVPTVLALMILVIILGGRKFLLMRLLDIKSEYLLQTNYLALLWPIPMRKY
jgi:hypothetical protein